MDRISRHNRVEALRNAEFYRAIRQHLENAEQLIWIHGMVAFRLYEANDANAVSNEVSKDVSELYKLFEQYETALTWCYHDGIQRAIEQLRDEMKEHFIEYQTTEYQTTEEDVEIQCAIADFQFPLFVRSKL